MGDYDLGLLFNIKSFTFSILILISICVTVIAFTITHNNKKDVSVIALIFFIAVVYTYQVSSLVLLYSTGRLFYIVISVKVFAAVLACAFLLAFLLTRFDLKISKRLELEVAAGIGTAYLLLMLYGPARHLVQSFPVYDPYNAIFLLVIIVIFLKYSPLLDRKLRILSTVDAIQGTDEMVVFLDEKNMIRYIHNGTAINELSERVQDVLDRLGMQNNEISTAETDTNEIYTSGEIQLFIDSERIIKYKAISFYENRCFAGVLIMLRDITKLNALLSELENKNLMLKDAFNRQKEYVKIELKLNSENERANILKKVNSMANKYLKEIKQEIQMIPKPELCAENDFRGSLKEHSSRILELTRKTTLQVRETVYDLRSKRKEEGV